MIWKHFAIHVKQIYFTGSCVLYIWTRWWKDSAAPSGWSEGFEFRISEAKEWEHHRFVDQIKHSVESSLGVNKSNQPLGKVTENTGSNELLVSNRKNEIWK